ncbi:YkyA family protein [Pontibacillus litoralis]|uniref:Cell-wall binding lipoprotein n=1 Tax=Pontibacillus litoralis JSM 072002 TaxID=1385512 RepID=A0A0A5GC59_9BACI|nr:YkyA family protein [Pontibacillus litoralis]KGX88788.1 hypothetical protein N784_00100 [Pontibacillus litoralis JSM 072002]
MRLGKLLLVLTSVIFVLSGCIGGPSAAEKMYNHLEEAVTLEAAFEDQQKSMVELEKKEKKIYDEIMELGLEDLEKIKNKSDEAISFIEQREDKLKVEKESIDAAKEEFDNVKSLVEDLENETSKEKANQMIEAFQNRYDAYQQLNEKYKASLKLDQELYEMLQKEDVEKDALEKQIEQVNKSYEKVMKANKDFNQYTKEYNDLKKQFYEAASLEVQYDDQQPSGEKDKEQSKEN